MQGHFVLSMLLVLDAVVLNHRAGVPDDRPPARPRSSRRPAAGHALVGLAAVVIADRHRDQRRRTALGPANGEQFVHRLPISPHDAARIHGVAMMLFLAVTVVLAVRLRRSGR